MPILSIIIPVYNTSKYLKECLDSIVSQNCKDVEIILVNDGSTDDSSKICEDYKNNFPNIVFVNNSNHGVSYSRNCGIDIANGKYLLFVDSDDILVANGLSQICRLLTENSLMYVYGYKKIYENREESYILNPKTISSVQALRLLVSDNNFGGYLWNKVFLKEIIEKNNIIFDDKIAMNEDMKFCFDYISCCDKINLVDDVFYKYRCRKSGAMNKKIDKTHATSALCYKYIIDQVKKLEMEVNFTFFVLYDLNYLNTKEEDFYKISPKVFKEIKIKYLSPEYVEKKKYEVMKKHNLTEYEAGLVIGKGYANGRAVDDNVAFVFDVTKLEEYVKPVRVVGAVTTTVDGTVTTESAEVQGA